MGNRGLADGAVETLAPNSIWAQHIELPPLGGNVPCQYCLSPGGMVTQLPVTISYGSGNMDIWPQIVVIYMPNPYNPAPLIVGLSWMVLRLYSHHRCSSRMETPTTLPSYTYNYFTSRFQWHLYPSVLKKKNPCPWAPRFIVNH